MTQADDPYLQCLIGIAAELTAIRQQLQQLNNEPPEPNLETFECRCGRVVAGESAAREHARDEHNAPRGAWSDLYR